VHYNGVKWTRSRLHQVIKLSIRYYQNEIVIRLLQRAENVAVRSLKN